jgi:F0F1-type ATP synthase epsilon subunit
MREQLQFLIRTPREIVLERGIRGLRVPTVSGQVGIRRGAEPLLLVVEAGLIVVHAGGVDSFAASAGGLLECDAQRCVLYTPFAVTGAADAEVLAALDRALATPDGELAARRHLDELEQRIVRELGHRSRRGQGAGW